MEKKYTVVVDAMKIEKVVNYLVEAELSFAVKIDEELQWPEVTVTGPLKKIQFFLIYYSSGKERAKEDFPEYF